MTTLKGLLAMPGSTGCCVHYKGYRGILVSVHDPEHNGRKSHSGPRPSKTDSICASPLSPHLSQDRWLHHHPEETAGNLGLQRPHQPGRSKATSERPGQQGPEPTPQNLWSTAAPGQPWGAPAVQTGGQRPVLGQLGRES